jgi:hypothetical protein
VPENSRKLSPRFFSCRLCSSMFSAISHPELYAVVSNTYLWDINPGTRVHAYTHTAKPGPVFANYLSLDITDLLVIGIRPGLFQAQGTANKVVYLPSGQPCPEKSVSPASLHTVSGTHLTSYVKSRTTPHDDVYYYTAGVIQLLYHSIQHVQLRLAERYTANNVSLCRGR